ncbi:MAG: hypothetical protein ATN31_00905 [Candidatus Epulonipiscioides saccharophilum]|nr:MAG: hypothetical protein ATN31_00905 [Epulopiscium sp. AS2M-Bin001]
MDEELKEQIDKIIPNSKLKTEDLENDTDQSIRKKIEELEMSLLEYDRLKNIEKQYLSEQARLKQLEEQYAAEYTRLKKIAEQTRHSREKLFSPYDKVNIPIPVLDVIIVSGILFIIIFIMTGMSL